MDENWVRLQQVLGGQDLGGQAMNHLTWHYMGEQTEAQRRRGNEVLEPSPLASVLPVSHASLSPGEA
jgi:hypothetical protein